MEYAEESEEDFSSKERDPLRRAQKEQTSMRNEEPEVGTCSKLWPYQKRINQKDKAALLPGDQVGGIEEDDHLGFEGYANGQSDIQAWNSEQREARNNK